MNCQEIICSFEWVYYILLGLYVLQCGISLWAGIKVGKGVAVDILPALAPWLVFVVLFVWIDVSWGIWLTVASFCIGVVSYIVTVIKSSRLWVRRQ